MVLVAELCAADWVNPLTGFLGGVLVTIFGAWITQRFQHGAEKHRTVGEARFTVYMKLMELQNPLFWLSGAEMRGEHRDPRFEHEFDLMRWRIADEVRKMDDAPEIEHILRVLFHQGFESAIKRYEALRGVIDELGKTCNPKYRDAMKRINEENMALLARQYEAKMATAANQFQSEPKAPKGAQ